MRLKFIVPGIAAIAISSATVPAAGQAPRDIVARGVTAMGGEAALRGVTSTTLTFNTATFGIGQEEATYTTAIPPRPSSRSMG
ncbi:MAG: hypothetical protein EXR93_08305 [Gemmatimonadetes bacterium]|nr:hypothetical protein [Gemmatimonadota bacterium]